MALNVGQPFKRTSKGQRFDGDVMTKAQMLAGDDTQFEDGYLVVEKDSHDLYIYDSTATPSAETGKFVKVETGSSNLPMTKTILWETNDYSTNPMTITLSDSIINYDMLYLYGWHFDQKENVCTTVYLNDTWHYNRRLGISAGYDAFVWYDWVSNTELAKADEQNFAFVKVVGVKFGSSLNGTIGRWEKIGEFPLNATSSIGVDLSEYNFFSATLLNGSHPTGNVRNSVNISRADLEEGLSFIVSEQADGDKWGSAKIDFTNSTIQINGYGAVTSLVLYGYKETAISDADVQKIADATALKSTNMEALWNNGELKGMKLFQNDKDLRLFDDGLALIIDDTTTKSVNLAKKDYVDTEVAKKQNTLVSGTNIKTVNNQSLLGSGDIPIPTIVGSDWGVAKTGSGAVPAASGSRVYNSTSVDISDLGFTSANDYQVVICSALDQQSQNASTDVSVIGKSATSFTVKALATNANMTLSFAVPFLYTIFAKGYGSVPNGGTTGQALVKKSNTDGDVEWKTVSGGGASLTIDTTDPNYGEATISEGGYNLSFTNQNGQGVHIGGISEDGEMVTSKSYVDSKSPTIVNEGATFTNAQGNQKMQIRTGSTNSVIIKDTNGDGTTEYWSYELPDKDYVDTELAKKGNTITTFDNEYKTFQTRDVNDSVEFQVVKETSNDYIRMNEYAEDDRGQMQQIFDVKLPTKEYVDSKGGGVNMEVGAEKLYGTYTQDGVTYQVYSKIVYIPALPSTAGITTYPMGVSNIKQILNIYGYTTDGFILNAPRQNVQDNISIYQVSKGSQTFSIEVGKDRSSKSAYVTIVYAKNNT